MTAVLPNINDLIQCGINPKTKLPLKFSNCKNYTDSIKRIIREQDLQDAVNTFDWFNLPDGLNTELIERMFYYRGTMAFFYIPTDAKFYCLPYALDGSIDVYGRFTSITPLPFNGSTENSKPWIKGLSRKPVHEFLAREITWEDIENSCVLMYDYTKQESQTVLSRKSLNEPLIELESECIPYARTSMILGTGVKGMRVNDADQAESVTDASTSFKEAALRGDGYIPIIGNIDFQELTDGANLKGADYMQMMQSIDNFRLNTHGLGSSGIFNKNTYVTETQYQLNNNTNNNYILMDRLRCRQEACLIINSIWGLKVWCELKEPIMPVQNNAILYSDNEGGNNNESDVQHDEV